MPYNPYGYPMYSQPMPDQLAQLRQGMGYQPPMMQQPTPQTAPATPSIIWVPNSQAAEGYLVAPNSAVVLWDSSAPVVYLKQADASGKPSMKTYDLVERIIPAQTAPQTAQQPGGEFVTRAEFDALAKRFSALEKQEFASPETEGK